MEKTSTLNLRVNPKLKNEAEDILSKLGIPMSTAINMFLSQVVLNNGIPFSVSLPSIPKEIDFSKISDEELINNLNKGIADYKNGNVTEFSKV